MATDVYWGLLEKDNVNQGTRDQASLTGEQVQTCSHHEAFQVKGTHLSSHAEILFHRLAAKPRGPPAAR